MRKIPIPSANAEHEPLNPWDVDTLRYAKRSWYPSPQTSRSSSKTKKINYNAPLSARSSASTTTTSTLKKRKWRYPQLAKLYPGMEPNQHGNPLLPEYFPTAEAVGLGYGSIHADHFRYLSHFSNNKVSSSLTGTEVKKIAAETTKRGGDLLDPGSLGYGPYHDDHRFYVSVRTSRDCPPASFEPLPTLRPSP